MNIKTVPISFKSFDLIKKSRILDFVIIALR